MRAQMKLVDSWHRPTKDIAVNEITDGADFAVGAVVPSARSPWLVIWTH